MNEFKHVDYDVIRVCVSLNKLACRHNLYSRGYSSKNNLRVKEHCTFSIKSISCLK